MFEILGPLGLKYIPITPVTVFPHHPEVLEAKRVSKAEDLLEKASVDKKVIKALKPKPKAARGRPSSGKGANGNKDSKTQNHGDVDPELPSTASATPSNTTAPPETNADEKMATRWAETEPRYVEYSSTTMRI